MSVLETNLIDYIYLEEDEDVPVLVISDPLSWRPPEDRRHLRVLRDKLKAQIAFVETGQINGVWPAYKGGLVRVQVYAACSLTSEARDFYDGVSHVMTEANMELRVRLLDA